jgi:hypothetical protein
MNESPYRLADPRDEALARLREEYAAEKVRLASVIDNLKADAIRKSPSWMASVMWWGFILAWSLVALAMIVVPPVLVIYRRVPSDAMGFIALGLVLGLSVFVPIYRARNGVAIFD